MKLKKMLALLLAALLLSSCCVFVAGAQEKMRYLVLGDSIGFGAGISNPQEANYGRIVANTNGYDYRNDAVNGHRTSDLLRRLQESAVAADVTWADIISVSIGGNNFLRGNMSQIIAEGLAGNFTRFDEIVTQFAADLESIVARIRTLNPHAYLLLQTVYNPVPGGRVTAVYQEALNRLNGAMKAYAAAHPGEITIVDVEAAFGADRNLISFDGIHPNAAGNVVIARTVLGSLCDLGIGFNTEPVIVTPGRDWTPSGFAGILAAIRDFFRRIISFFTGLFS